MATLKWKKDDTWETFYYGAFENVKADLRNIIIAINNAAAGIRRRCCRDKNLSDLYSAEIARKNLGLIGDCSDESKMGISPHYHDCYHLVRKKNLSDVYDTAESRTNIELINDCSALTEAPHHHDSRYIPLIDKERDDRKAEDAKLSGIIDELERRINNLRECNCTNEPDEPHEPEPSSPKTITVNLNNMHGSASNEHIHWYQHVEGVINNATQARLVLHAVITGQGAIGVSFNGAEQENRWHRGSYNTDEETVSCEFGPFSVNNNGNNTLDIGVDGDNKIGINLLRGTIDIILS